MRALWLIALFVAIGCDAVVPETDDTEEAVTARSLASVSLMPCQVHGRSTSARALPAYDEQHITVWIPSAGELTCESRWWQFDYEGRTVATADGPNSDLALSGVQGAFYGIDRSGADAVLSRLSLEGILEWSKPLDISDPHDDNAYSIQPELSSQENQTDKVFYILYDHWLSSGTGYSSTQIQKVTAAGSAWSFTLPSDILEVGGLLRMGDGGALLVARESISEVYAQNRRGGLVRIGPAGNMVWRKSYEAEPSVYRHDLTLQAVVPRPDGGFWGVAVQSIPDSTQLVVLDLDDRGQERIRSTLSSLYHSDIQVPLATLTPAGDLAVISTRGSLTPGLSGQTFSHIVDAETLEARSTDLTQSLGAPITGPLVALGNDRFLEFRTQSRIFSCSNVSGCSGTAGFAFHIIEILVGD